LLGNADSLERLLALNALVLAPLSVLFLLLLPSQLKKYLAKGLARAVFVEEARLLVSNLLLLLI
jgi:hypothetical protein